MKYHNYKKKTLLIKIKYNTCKIECNIMYHSKIKKFFIYVYINKFIYFFLFIYLFI